MTSHVWKPIAPLALDWAELASRDLPPLLSIWQEQATTLKTSPAYKQFMEQLRRDIAIETGIIERLYSLDRGITTLLIERGIDEALVPHNATDRPIAEVMALIRDQHSAVESVFDFVATNRNLGTAYIKELHAMLTQHQPTVKALDPVSGKLFDVELVRGDWKRQPNNPQRDDGSVHEYAPPEHASSEMDALIAGYYEQENQGVPPEIQAAWLHHRFTQVHPFQDGNGRVARLLASLVFIKHGFLPLTIRNEDRDRYISALEAADRGALGDLVTLFAEKQKQSFIHALSLSDQVLTQARQVSSILTAVRDRLARESEASRSVRARQVDAHALRLLNMAERRLSGLRNDILSTLDPAIEVNAYVGKALPNEGGRSQWHAIPINVTAKQLKYFANRRVLAAWTDLGITVGSSRTQLLISFHGLGFIDRGIRVCSVSGYHKELGEDGTTSVTQIEPLSNTPFQFSYLEESGLLDHRFNVWLEETLLAGLEYWQRSV